MSFLTFKKLSPLNSLLPRLARDARNGILHHITNANYSVRLGKASLRVAPLNQLAPGCCGRIPISPDSFLPSVTGDASLRIAIHRLDQD